MANKNEIPIIEFASAQDWQIWLAINFENTNGIWLKIYKKGAEIKTVTYAEALDEALCYGWIDGQKKSFDEQAWLQKFCPRGAKSIWSKVNTAHIERLTKAGRMKPSGLKVVEEAKADGRWEKAYESASTMTIPDDFLKELKKNKIAEMFFKTLNKTNLYAIAFRLQTAKKQETRQKRIETILDMLANGKKFH